MLSSLPITIAIGVALGFLSGLGIGGGTLLILWLTQVIDMDAASSRIINLLFFIVAAGSTSIIRINKKEIPFRKILPAILTGCITAGIFTIFGSNLNSNILRKVFGGLLLITGFRELFYRAK